MRQQHWDDDGTFGEEYLYFVTSLDTTLFNFKQLLRLVRVHRGIENRHHWTLDGVLGEDERQPCRPARTALEVVAWLHALAFNLLQPQQPHVSMTPASPIARVLHCFVPRQVRLLEHSPLLSLKSTHARLLLPRFRSHGGTGHWGDGARRPHPSASVRPLSVEHLLLTREAIRTVAWKVVSDSAHPLLRVTSRPHGTSFHSLPGERIRPAL